jgi:hypothetical protein
LQYSAKCEIEHDVDEEDDEEEGEEYRYQYLHNDDVGITRMLFRGFY